MELHRQEEKHGQCCVGFRVDGMEKIMEVTKMEKQTYSDMEMTRALGLYGSHIHYLWLSGKEGMEKNMKATMKDLGFPEWK